MYNSNPKKIALNNAVFIALFFLLMYALITILLGQFHLLSLLLLTAGIFVFSFIIINYSVEKFIYQKIRIIYKNIHNIKVSKKTFLEQMKETPDLLENVNQDVLDWVVNKSKEVEDLKKLEIYRKEYIGNVSHELKTPVFNIQGYISTLLEGGMEDAAINKEYLERSEKNVNRMISILHDLEEISRLETGELKLHYTHFDIIALVKEVFEHLHIKAEQKNIILKIAPTDEKQKIVEADRERIRQVLINLIENSLKYSKDENASTKVSFYDMDKLMLIEVADNGIGVSEADIPRLFERFYRTDKGRARTEGGTGLGLSIVKHIIEAHQQTINVRSTLGVGTTFGFTLQKGG
ncbi:MAG: ATP-binding protein [Bacteroidetes bacterium]|nr:ATP-binding protein [Bacteroidota bacterium]